MIIWFTGQPGAGKTTLSNHMLKFLNEKTIQIDGDKLRDIFSNYDYTVEGRKKNITNVITIARFLDYNNYNVLISVVAPFKELRDSLKKTNDVIEVYLHTNEVRGRENFFSKCYEPPDKDFLDLDTGKLSIEECTNKVLEKLKSLG